MAHDKVYGICENKCFVEVSPKTDVVTAQETADSKVSKSGDTMTGGLTVNGVFSTPKGNRAELSQVGGGSEYGKWYRVASMPAITESYNDSHLMVGVWDNYNYNGYPVVRTGILNVHVRRANTSFTGNIRFILAGSEIDNDAYALVTYSDYSAELYVKQTNSYGRPSFARLNPTENTNRWVMHNSDIVSVDSLDSLGGTITYANLPVISPPTSATDSSNAPATTAWVNNIDNDVVHKSRNETISGVKTFGANIIQKNTKPEIYIQDSDTTTNKNTPPTDADKNVFYLQARDNAWNTFGNLIGLIHKTDGSYVFSFGNSARSWSGGIQLISPSSGSEYATAPSTPDDATENEIATADWVNTKLAEKNKVTTFSSYETLWDLVANGKRGDMFGIVVDGTMYDMSSGEEVTMTATGFFSLMTIGNRGIFEAIGSGSIENDYVYCALTKFKSSGSITTFYGSKGTTPCHYSPLEGTGSDRTVSGYYISI